MEIAVYLCCALLVMLTVLTIFALLRLKALRQEETQWKEETDQRLNDLSDALQDLSGSCADSIQQLGQLVSETQRGASEAQSQALMLMTQSVCSQISQLQSGMNAQLEQMSARLTSLEASTRTGMDTLRTSNDRHLQEIRATVDEKLQTALEARISESFRSVSEQLERVYRGLGDMQSLASDVGGLKKVLTGVKTRGILGEVQLGAILQEILSPAQYETNVATVPGSTNRVEFAIRMPNTDDSFVYLPIDSKFPGDTYSALLAAQESGDRAAVAAAWKALEVTLCKEAGDISEKYLQPPYTTTFGIMFLPFEGLYAEVAGHDLIERLQHDYHVNVAGPSTMAALLNSLQMGFRTLAIQKRSGEAWQVLGAVKTEFSKFRDVMLKMQDHLNKTNSDLETLLGARTRSILKQLNTVEEPGALPEVSQEDDDE